MTERTNHTTPTPTPCTSSSQRNVTGRLTDRHPSHACSFTLNHVNTSLQFRERCDYGSEYTIISPRITEKTVFQGVGKLSAITPIHVQVALKSQTEADAFSFFRSLLVPRFTMHLSAGQIALLNVAFLVADSELWNEDLPIGLPLLTHLGIDSSTMLEHNRLILDGTDCSTISNNTGAPLSKVGRILADCIAGISGTSPPPSLST